MSRNFVQISPDELKSKIQTALWGEEYLPYSELTTTVAKDLSKVKFSTENITEEGYEFGPHELLGYQVLPNGMSYFGVCAGGDWETPVFFIIYWDGKKLRGYIPENGNLYNADTKEAFGNDDAADLKYARKRWPDNKDLKDDDIDLQGFFDNYDIEAIKKDIINRISLKIDKPTNKKKGFIEDFTDEELLDELRWRLADVAQK